MAFEWHEAIPAIGKRTPRALHVVAASVLLHGQLAAGARFRVLAAPRLHRELIYSGKATTWMRLELAGAAHDPCTVWAANSAAAVGWIDKKRTRAARAGAMQAVLSEKKEPTKHELLVSCNEARLDSCPGDVRGRERHVAGEALGYRPLAQITLAVLLPALCARSIDADPSTRRVHMDWRL